MQADSGAPLRALCCMSAPANGDRNPSPATDDWECDAAGARFNNCIIRLPPASAEKEVQSVYVRANM